MKKIIKISGMHCKSCKALIESEVNDIDGVVSIEITVESGKAVISMNKDCTEEVLDVIRKMKYEVEVVE